MIRKHPRLTSRTAFLLATLFMAGLLQSPAVDARILASRALAEAIANDTFSEAQQDMMMDLYQRQKYEFDEPGIEALGRRLLDRGEGKTALEVLQLNQLSHGRSPAAANALADAYRSSNDPTMARVYYDTALGIDPGNEPAARAIEEMGDSAEGIAMGDLEFDPEALQEAMAQMGMEMSPELQRQMGELQEYLEDPGSYQAPERNKPQQAPSDEPAYESEFCEMLHTNSADWKISDPQVRARVEGEYQDPGSSNWTWNVEATCGEFLIAIPLWADISPPVLKLQDVTTFKASNGDSWKFTLGGDGQARSATRTSSDGTVSEMPRLGEPQTWD